MIAFLYHAKLTSHTFVSIEALCADEGPRYVLHRAACAHRRPQEASGFEWTRGRGCAIILLCVLAVFVILIFLLLSCSAASYKPVDDRYVVKLDSPASADEPEVAVLASNLTPVGVKRVKDVRACANCAAVEPEAGTFPKCDSCKCTWYCGAECQRVHWKATHKRECKEIQARGTLVIAPAVSRHGRTRKPIARGAAATRGAASGAARL